MKRFLRWLLLVICVVILTLWVVSVIHADQIIYVSKSNTLISAGTGWGKVYIQFNNRVDGRWPREGLSHWKKEMSLPLGQTDWSTRLNQLGMSLPDVTTLSLTGPAFVIPYWVIFTPIFLLTIAIWYPLLKSKLRGIEDKGFEVELKDQSIGHRQTSTSSVQESTTRLSSTKSDATDSSVKSA